MYPEAVEADLSEVALHGAGPDAVAKLRAAYEQTGWNGYWQKMLARRERADAQKQLDGAVFVAQIYARLGKNDQAFEFLNQACDQRSLWVIWLKVDSTFDRLHSDSRWPGLMRRVGLA